MKKRLLSRILSVLLVVSMVAAFAVPAGASQRVNWKESNHELTLDLSEREVQIAPQEPEHQPEDQVRVTIMFEEKSTIEAGYSTMGIAQNEEAIAYRNQLQKQQENMVQKISDQVLGGKELDVVWYMTLVGNMISANVRYDQISDIEKVAGVKKVVLENIYEPAVVSKEETVEPQMYTSSGMIGSQTVWTEGFTGAGSRIAVIDTGIDAKHQSFNNDAYLHALDENAKALKMSKDEYLKKIDPLDKEEINSVLSQLNIHKRTPNITADQLFVSDKLAFAYNYIDRDLYVGHDKDQMSEHGSHVSGISAANRFIKKGDKFVDAAKEVYVCGVAPDAQILTMKVGGKRGGIYDSDYMAAIEDAIVLGCDAANLSLGSTNPGSPFNKEYAVLLDELTKTNMVVVISAGNAGSWADYTANQNLYADDVSFDTAGSPGSYTNSFGVASVNNSGSISPYFQIGDKKFGYDNGSSGKNLPFATLDTNDNGLTELPYVFVEGIGQEKDYTGINLKDKVVFCSRGESSFAAKATLAVSLGAKAVIIYNNQEGQFGANLTGYADTNPVATISKKDSDVIKAASKEMTAEGGAKYYEGTMKVDSEVAAIMNSSEFFTMSDFSSWGVPGDLSMKPEITAPGGNIYSVNGLHQVGPGQMAGGHDEYELMSGTSMAAPQVSGMVALMAQYMQEKGVDKATGMSARHMAQSLLMSTAQPMKEEATGTYYSLLKQGAGLARIDRAVAADSYITVNGQEDGKVKAELGDDPERTGSYTFSFKINNMTDKEQKYALSADAFTQAVGVSENVAFLLKQTTDVKAATAFTSKNAEIKDGNVTVPAKGSVQVDVTMTLDQESKKMLDEKTPKGAYVEAFVYVKSVADAQGATGTDHNIPVLGYYGSWSEPSMYEKGSWLEYNAGAETRAPYLYQANNVRTNFLGVSYDGKEEYLFGGNPVAKEENYMPQRNAMNNSQGASLTNLYFTQIRNAGDYKLVINNADTGENYYQFTDNEDGTVSSAFFYSAEQKWYGNQYNLELNWKGTDAKGKPLPDGTKVEVRFITALDYYRNDDGTYAFDKLGKGAYLTVPFTIDNTKPEMVAVQENTEKGRILNVTAKDNQYVAGVQLLNADASEVLAVGTPNQTEANVESVTKLDISKLEGEKAVLAVFDYAGNYNAYDLSLCPSAGYTDVDQTQWYHEAVDYVVANGLMQGVGNNLFRPNTYMTRAQLVTVLYRMAGEPTPQTKNPFKDVRDNAWYANAVVWAYENKIVQGVGNDRFAPENKVTREQTAMILYNCEKGADNSSKPNQSLENLDAYADAGQVSNYAVEAMKWACGNGIIKGVGGNRLAPQHGTTRAQMAALLMRLIDG